MRILNFLPFMGIFWFILILTIDTNFTQIQQNFLAIFVLIFWSWIFTRIPLFAVGLLGVSLTVIFGVSDAKSAFAPFSQDIIFLFLGGFLLSKAMSKTHLDKRISYHLLSSSLVGGSFKKMLFLMLFLTSIFSMWMSNTASTAMMIPIILGILKSLEIHDKRTITLILLGIAYSASIGGLGTPIGSPPNFVAIGLLKETINITVGFLDWMIVAVPFMIVFFLFLFIYINYHLPSNLKTFNRQIINKMIHDLPSISSREVILVIVFLTTVFFWFLPSLLKMFDSDNIELLTLVKKRFPPGGIAIFFSSLLFIFPTKLPLKYLKYIKGHNKKNTKSILNWEDIKTIDWGSLLLFGSGLSLGTILFDTGLAQWVADLIQVYLTGNNQFLTIMIMVYITIFATEIISNTATANIIIPIIIAMSLKLGLNPLILTFGVALATSMSFMLPVATPPNAIVYGTGLIDKKIMISFGFLLNIIFGLFLTIGLYFGSDIINNIFHFNNN